jgi:superfamily II DNA or RNA helicase
VIGLINSLVSDNIKLDKYENYIDFFKSFDFVVLDEIHYYCTKDRRKIYDRCQAPYMLGLSATPEERSDKLD